MTMRWQLLQKPWFAPNVRATEVDEVIKRDPAQAHKNLLVLWFTSPELEPGRAIIIMTTITVVCR